MRSFKHLAILCVLLMLLCILTCCDKPDEELSSPDTDPIIIRFVDGETLISEENLNIATLTTPIPPSKTDFSFNGWYFDKDFHIPFNIESVPEHVANNLIVVYARYTPIDTVTPTVNISFMSDGSEYHKVTIEKGAIFTMPANPTKAHFTFKGWYIDDSFATKFNYMEAQSNGINADLTLYAKFEEITAKMTFKVHGNSYDTITIMKSKEITMPTNPILDGKTFLYWIEEGKSTPFDLEAFSSEEEVRPITLNAVFVNNSVTITLIVDNATIDTLIVKKDEKITTLPTPDKTMTHVFDQWLYEDGSTFDINNFNENEFRENITLVAKFVPRKNTLNFYSSDNLVDTIIVDEHLTIEMPNEPTQDGHVFKYWYYLENGLEKVFNPQEYLDDIDRKDMDMYAYFDIIRATVNWKYNEEILHTDTLSGDDILSLYTAPKLSNKTFKEWRIDGKILDIDMLNIQLENAENQVININAVYISKKTFVQFITEYTDISTGDKISLEHARLIFDEDKTFVMPKDPNIQGYSFINWYTDKNFTELFDIDNYRQQQDRKDISVYAKLEPVA